MRMWGKGALCTVGLPCRPAGPGMAPFCGLPTPIPCSLPECGCPWSRGLHRQGSVPWASPLQAQRALQPTGWTRGLTHAGAAVLTSSDAPFCQSGHPQPRLWTACSPRLGPGGGTGATYHIGVGDLCQEIHQGVSSERAHILILLKPTDGGPHASSCNHRRRVHGKLEVCGDERWGGQDRVETGASPLGRR